MTVSHTPSNAGDFDDLMYWAFFSEKAYDRDVDYAINGHPLFRASTSGQLVRLAPPQTSAEYAAQLLKDKADEEARFAAFRQRYEAQDPKACWFVNNTMTPGMRVNKAMALLDDMVAQPAPHIASVGNFNWVAVQQGSTPRASRKCVWSLGFPRNRGGCYPR